MADLSRRSRLLADMEPAVGARKVGSGPPGPVLRQASRFVVVGGTNTLLSWCAYALMTYLGIAHVAASALAFTLGALNSYALNRRWTFRSRGRRAPELRRFALVQAVGLAIDVAVLSLLTHDAGVHHLVAQALAFPAASVVTFVLSRRWAFAGAASL